MPFGRDARSVTVRAVRFGVLGRLQIRRPDGAEVPISGRARRQLLADMCHELSTPLTAIRGYVETLLMKDVTFESITRERYLGIIEQETHRIERRVADLLDLARLEAGGGILSIQAVSIAELFRYVVATA